jgi:hypothetical protein
MMLKLIEQIRTRLVQGSYVNEAAISHGIVTPILNALGWDSADPDQLVPEYSVENGRVDFALLGLARKPVVFVEVKGVGRALDGDRQLFSYSFHHGVPLCVLTAGASGAFMSPRAKAATEIGGSIASSLTIAPLKNAPRFSSVILAMPAFAMAVLSKMPNAIIATLQAEGRPPPICLVLGPTWPTFRTSCWLNC